MPSQVNLCDGCNVRQPHEHRCHGKGCGCEEPRCMNYQGRLPDEDFKRMVSGFFNKASKKGKKK